MPTQQVAAPPQSSFQPGEFTHFLEEGRQQATLRDVNLERQKYGQAFNANYAPYSPPIPAPSGIGTSIPSSLNPESPTPATTPLSNTNLPTQTSPTQPSMVEEITSQGVLTPDIGYISGLFKEPSGRDGRQHLGTDVAATPDKTFPAPTSGMVEIGENQTAGKFIRIVNPNTNDYVLMAHCGEILVKEGQEVTAGQPVATPGIGGNVKGENPYHIHFGVNQNKQWVDPIRALTNYFKALLKPIQEAFGQYQDIPVSSSEAF